MKENNANEKRKTSKRRKIIAILGIIFVTGGIFLTSFGLSFKMLMMPEVSKDSELDKLRTENSQLKDENKRLEEENDILKGKEKSSAIRAEKKTENSDED